MDELFDEMIASLREGQSAMDLELRPLLAAQSLDWSMLMRLRDVADEYAGRARLLRQMMTDAGAEADTLQEVDQFCQYFDGTADLIAQETGDADVAAPEPPEDGAARG
jgi:hypothetical protein